MSPYASSGSLTTDVRSTAISETWDSDSDWNAAQSTSNVVVTNGTVQLEQQTIPSSGVARYTFDSADTSSGTAMDVWGSNGGTINGATTGVGGANQTYSTNEAYGFDGSNDYVQLPDDASLDISSAVSVAAWFQLTDVSSGVIATKGDALGSYDWDLSVDSGEVYWQGESGQSRIFQNAASINSGSWYHVIGVYDGSESRLYTDGTMQASQSASDDLDTDDVISIGGDTGNGYYSEGRIDDVRIYSKGLTDTEASGLYNNGSII